MFYLFLKINTNNIEKYVTLSKLIFKFSRNILIIVKTDKLNNSIAKSNYPEIITLSDI